MWPVAKAVGNPKNTASELVEPVQMCHVAHAAPDQCQNRQARQCSGQWPRFIRINRAPVLTLWVAVVAQRLGFRWGEALTLGKALAGLNVYSKGVSLGLMGPAPKAVREERRAEPAQAN